MVMVLLQFLRRHSLAIVVAVSLFLLALAVFTSQPRGSMSFLEGLVGEVISPIQKAIYRAASFIHGSIAEIKERRNLRENYEQLKERVEQLEKELLRMNELEKQNQRLKKLLDFAVEREELVVTGARVTGKDPGNWFNVFTIDKGKNQGIAVNMAVVTERGLVGRIIEVGPNWAKVRSIVDAQSSISGIVERTRDNGIVKGNNAFGAEDGTCSMVYLPLDSEVSEGDKVITSGLGDFLPKGIYIGEVIKVVRYKKDLYKTAVIKPGVDFQRLEEVLVVKARSDE
jgi:rod shape-determining protein MreC